MFLKFKNAWHHVDSVVAMVECGDRTYILQKDGKWRYHMGNTGDSELPEDILEFPTMKTISIGHSAGRDIVQGNLYIISPDIGGYLYEKDKTVHIPGPGWHIEVMNCTLTEIF